MIPIILGLLLSFVSAYIDTGRRFVNHTPVWIARLIITLILGFLGGITLSLYILNVLTIGITFYTTFDYFLNILEKRDIFYIGTTAKSDILWRKLGDNAFIFQLVFKLFLFITILIISYANN